MVQKRVSVSSLEYQTPKARTGGDSSRPLLRAFDNHEEVCQTGGGAWVVKNQTEKSRRSWSDYLERKLKEGNTTFLERRVEWGAGPRKLCAVGLLGLPMSVYVRQSSTSFLGRTEQGPLGETLESVGKKNVRSKK